MADFTKQQDDAINNHQSNLIVVAGAGSGKTRVLVERYLTLLEKNPTWSINALVAITFTREAALEMRNRVRQDLEERAQKAENRTLWANHLAQMDSARITTIHGLCADILRANAAEAGIDPRFEVLEPVESINLLSDVIDIVLQDLANDDADDSAALFTEYDMSAIRDVLSNADILSMPIGDPPSNAQTLFQQWQAEWEHNVLTAVDALRTDEQFHELSQWQPQGGTIPIEDKLGAIFVEIDDLLPILYDSDANQAVLVIQQILDAINLRYGSQKNWGSKEVVNEAKDVLREIRAYLEQLLEQIGTKPAALDQRAAQLTIWWYHLVLRVRQAYQAAKAENSYLDFNDLESLTANLLHTKPSVSKRYRGAEFKRLLVDEFQDTNQDQWQIVQSLTDLDNDVALFVVGDLKQSIYGFRGADVSVFNNVRRVISALPHGEKLSLSRSFRSHPGLINSFNKLFEQILTHNPASPVAKYEIEFDEAMDAHRDALSDEAKQHYGSIELLLLNTSNLPEDESINSQERRMWEAYEIAQRLKQLKQQGAPILDKKTDQYRGFEYGDAAILFQSTSHITLYETVLKSQDIPFVTIAGRGYYNRQEVWDVLNLLKSLHNPADNLSLAAALRSPMFAFSDDMLLALRLLLKENDDRQPLNLWDALDATSIPTLNTDQFALVKRARAILYDLHHIAGRVTISELLRKALAKTGYLAVLTGLPNGARLRRNVEKLLDIAQSSGKVALGSFSAYLSDLSAREVREGEAMLETQGVMRLMTVHASKGLEFPIVILADASWNGGNNRKPPLMYDVENQRLACTVWNPEDRKQVGSYPYQYATILEDYKVAAEKKRLLYVAATRARDSLIISGELRERKSGWGSYGWLGDILDPLEVTAHEGEAHDGYEYPYAADGNIRLWLPAFDREILRRIQGGEDYHEWQPLKIKQAVDEPERLKVFDATDTQMLGHIAATQLEDLGSYYTTSDDYYRQNVMRQVFDDTPAQIRDAIRLRAPRVRSRQIGEVVHEALQYWRFPENTPNLDQVLRSYAWQQNITDPDDVTQVVKRAHSILSNFQTSNLYHRIQSVRNNPDLRVYSEMPFVYKTQKRIIHGVIDLLFQDEDGAWWIVDYKTSVLRLDGKKLSTVAENHARRYHLQMGAYAAAASQELGAHVIPRVIVHYIQYNETVEIDAAVWQAAIQQLENVIGELIGNPS
jgi:ATP-dependent helicase/nuclease subunit A